MSNSSRNLPKLRSSTKNYSLSAKDRDTALVQRSQKLASSYVSSSQPQSRRTSPLPLAAHDNLGQSCGASPSGPPYLGTTGATQGPSPGPSGGAVRGDNAATFRISPAESLVAAQKDLVAERWRSALLEYETDLRELVVEGADKPPTVKNITKTVRIYDDFCRVAEEQSPFLAEMLRLFRIEFCRAIFSKQNVSLSTFGPAVVRSTDSEPSDAEGHTYFDQVSTLMRENVFLSAEVAVGNSKEKLTELHREVDRMKETLALYENDIDRLTRQNDVSLEQCRQSREQLRATESKYEAQIAKMESELQNVMVENKDMQLQLFRLRKQVSGGKAKILKDSYKQMKSEKMSMMTTLFAEGDERVALLILYSQIESRLNEILDTYDNEYVLVPENSRRDLQRKMCSAVVVLLEEIHLCEQGYRRLVPPLQERKRAAKDNKKNTTDEEIDETDGFLAVMFNPKIYERLMSREVLRNKVQDAEKHLKEMKAESDPTHATYQPFQVDRFDTNTAAPTTTTTTSATTQQQQGAGRSEEGAAGAAGGGDGSKAPQRERLMSLSSAADVTKKLQARQQGSTVLLAPQDKCNGKSTREMIEEKRDEWIQNIFGTDALLGAINRNGAKISTVMYPADHLEVNEQCARLIRHPMRDISSRKFLSSLDVFGGRDPIQQKMICTVNHVDPSEPIRLPESTNYLKIKYKPSMTERPGEVRSPTVAAAMPTGAATNAGAASPIKKTHAGARPSAAAQAIVDEWGGKTAFAEERDIDDEKDKALMNVRENLRVFKELSRVQGEDTATNNSKAGGVSSTTATAVAFQRLNPLSPNRAPEWNLYQKLFGGYRSLTPRIIEISTVDHILLRACERHFLRLENRYDYCHMEANTRSTNYQMCMTMAERYFREAYELTDFQESIVDELEERYGYPELVAKSFYEMLCFMDTMAPTDPIVSLYLSVIRGFFPPTFIHYLAFMMFNLSYGWPTANPVEEVTREDALTVLRYLYRNADNVVHVNIHDTLHDFEMATRSSNITFLAMRQFLATSILHMEETMILYFNSLFQKCFEVENIKEFTYENYADVIMKQWQVKLEKKSLVRFLSTGLGFNRSPLLSVKDLTWVASSAWCTQLWM